MDESIQKLIYTAISIVFLLLALVLITTLLRSLNPQEQIALANTEKLRAAIEEACFTGDRTVKIEMDLPQNIPWFGSVFTILPRWIIKTAGDPNFLLYYETFPPGEAVGWETYHDFEERLIITLDESFEGADLDSVKSYVLDIHKTYEEENPGKSVEEIFISNVVINGTFDRETRLVSEGDRFVTRGGEVIAGTADDPNLERIAEKIFNLGEWDSNSPLNVRDIFKFVNYMSLPAEDKTTIKYYACGDNTLCMKARDGIHRFPLEHCEGIDYIQLVYDPPKTKESVKLFISGTGLTGAGVLLIENVEEGIIRLLGAGFSAIEIGKTVLFLATSWKVSDFYIASPCSEQVFEISIEDCSATNAGPTGCVRPVKYPIYQFSDGILTAKYMKNNNEITAWHTACIDNIIGEEKEKPPASDFEEIGNCVRVKAVERIKSSTLKGMGEFCWTLNPYTENEKESFFKKMWNYVSLAVISSPIIAFQYSSLQDLTSRVGGMPVTDSAGYDINNRVFILQSSKTSMVWYDKFLQAHGSPTTTGVQRFLHWGWP